MTSSGQARLRSQSLLRLYSLDKLNKSSHSQVRLWFHLRRQLPRQLLDNLPLVNPPRCRQQSAPPRQRVSSLPVPQPQLQLSPRLRQPPILFPRVQLPRSHSALLVSFPSQQFAPSHCSRLLPSLFPRLPLPSRLPLPPLDNPPRRRRQPSHQHQRRRHLFPSPQLSRGLPLRPPLVNLPPHRRKSV